MIFPVLCEISRRSGNLFEARRLMNWIMAGDSSLKFSDHFLARRQSTEIFIFLSGGIGKSIILCGNALNGPTGVGKVTVAGAYG